MRIVVFPEPRRTEQGHEFALPDAEGQIVHDERATVVTLAHAFELDMHGAVGAVSGAATGIHLAVLPFEPEYGQGQRSRRPGNLK